MQTKKTMLTIAVCGVLSWFTHAAVVSGVSAVLAVDTRSKTELLAATDTPCDTRSFTDGSSEWVTVNTHVPAGTLLMLR